MASGGVGSSSRYRGTVEFSTKSYGFIKLDKGNPVPLAFFDKSSISGRIPDDLTDLYKKGTKVDARIDHTDGKHKIKFKAKELQVVTRRYNTSKSSQGVGGYSTSSRGRGRGRHRPMADQYDQQDGEMINQIQNIIDNICKEEDNWRNKTSKSSQGGGAYLKHYLKDGACQLENLAENLSNSQDNCPRFLRDNDVEQIRNVVSEHPDWFIIKSGFVCLKEAEDDVLEEIMEEMETYNNQIPFAAMSAVIPPDHDHRKYLHSREQWNVGIKDFVARNKRLVYWDEHIWNKGYLFSRPEIMSKFQKDLEAVTYYAQFVTQPVAISSLRGHYNQASKEVKEVASAKESDFKEFLDRNSFFFVLRGDHVKECPPHRLSCIESSWQKKKKDNKKQNTTSTSSSNPVPQPRKSSAPLSPAKQPIIIPPLMQVMPSQPAPASSGKKVSKAFSDMEAEFKKCVQVTDNKTESYSFEFNAPAASPMLFDSVHDSAQSPYQSRLFSSPETAVFKKLIGNNIAGAIQEEILSEDTLNSLLLLRLNIGKPPMAIFRIPGEKNGLKHDLKLPPCKIEDIQRILMQPEVVKSNDRPNRYYVKRTLHSILTRESAGKVNSLTLRCQIHEPSEGLGLEVRKWKSFTAVFTGNYPDKYIYNYLRTRSQTLSKSEDVLVIDVDGQLYGNEEHPHSSIGTVTRITCPSSTDLSPLILESIEHSHGHMITLDVDAVDHLKAIQKMCGQGTRVLAAVSSDLKSDAESMFS